MLLGEGVEGVHLGEFVSPSQKHKTDYLTKNVRKGCTLLNSTKSFDTI